MIGDNLRARFARHGVAADRIKLLGATARGDHLAALNGVDIGLDPFPQNGGVSTWESLQMGVPVIAKLGNTLPSRVAGAILAAVGLHDWVADSEEDYLDIALAHASQIGELAELRRQLPGRIAASPAGNPGLYADAVANAYRAMWRAWCARNAE
jgi:predicted O-linked N-acetylglucosamine transferase (SPINDLY family)